MIEDNSLSKRGSVDGLNQVVDTLTIPTGEIWYVGSLYLTGDGSGDDSNLVVEVAVGEPTTLDNIAPDLNNAPRGALANIDSSLISTDIAAVDAYGTGGEEVQLSIDASGGTTGGFHYFLEVRRLL